MDNCVILEAQSNEAIVRYYIEDKYEVYQKSHYITCEGAGIYVRHNALYRKHFTVRSGERVLIADKKITENHALMMYEPLLERGPEKEP